MILVVQIRLAALTQSVEFRFILNKYITGLIRESCEVGIPTPKCERSVGSVTCRYCLIHTVHEVSIMSPYPSHVEVQSTEVSGNIQPEVQSVDQKDTELMEAYLEYSAQFNRLVEHTNNGIKKLCRNSSLDSFI